MISIVLGTRPEIIKMSPVIRLCVEQELEYQLIHTGQHYSINMDKVFFDELHLPQPDSSLDVGTESSLQGHQTGLMLQGIEEVLMRTKPDVVLVQGDTNSVLAGALAACKLQIKVGHVEAGLRSYDRNMPEEHNRVMTDHISDYLFCPTKEAALNCRKEGIPEEFIHVTGNTIVDAVQQNLKISEKESNIMKTLDLEENGFILMTAHRQENVDDKTRFSNIIKACSLINERIIYPIHPRARKMFNEFGLQASDNLKLIEPLGYLDFLKLENNARLIMTDSGGLQEEACILGTPCLTLRENTERPETVEVGANKVVGFEPENISAEVKDIPEDKREYENPFGDGKASERIIDITTEPKDQVVDL